MIHNKVSSRKFYKEINAETGYIWEDVSWDNDECDSIFCENLDVQVFFPSEYYPGFLVVPECAEGAGYHEELEMSTIDEVIEFINNIEN